MIHILPRWLPALLVMVLIFLLSSRPAAELPDFQWADGIIKKGGHLIGYGLLALSYWYAFGMQKERRGLSWLLALGYAVSDELHQSLVPGRFSSVWDVLLFDNLGALISLGLVSRERRGNALLRRK